MSKISIKPNDSGTGTFTLESPNSNTDRTLTLPDEAGTVLTTATDIESQVKTATNATGSAPIYACRAWVNFDGTGTVAIRNSGNVSSVTENVTGDYTINFTTAMEDSNYSVSGLVQQQTTNFQMNNLSIANTSTAILNSSVRVFTSNARSNSITNVNMLTVCISVFR